MGAWLLAALFAAPAGFELAAHAEGAAGTAAQAGAASGTGALSASATLDGVFEGARLRASYAPSLSITGAQGGAGLLHTLVLGGTGQTGRLTLSASAAGSLGRQDFSPLTASPGGVAPPIDRLPSQQLVTVAGFSGQVGGGYTFDSRLQAAATASAGTQGGLGAQAGRVLPRQDRVGGGGHLNWQADRLDTLSGGVDVGAGTTTFSDGTAAQRSRSISAALSWGHRLSPTTTGSLGIAAAVTSNSGSQSRQGAFFPGGAATLATSLPLRGQSLAFVGAVSAEPAFDPLTGVAYLRGTGTATSTWSPRPGLGFSGSISGARALGGPLAHDWAASGVLSGSLALDRAASFTLGVRGALLPDALAVAGAPARGNSFQWIAFAGVSSAFGGAF
jgi:hypothetical protein